MLICIVYLCASAYTSLPSVTLPPRLTPRPSPTCSSDISFSILTSQQLQQQGLVHVVAKNLYNQDPGRTPVQHGVLDRRMVSATAQAERKEGRPRTPLLDRIQRGVRSGVVLRIARNK